MIRNNLQKSNETNYAKKLIPHHFYLPSLPCSRLKSSAKKCCAGQSTI
ncbi:unnamed protein product [Chondrus crispus]|uniref:Uncharacterized protein n=1 Tax=Chondrus crispus TaxID=2769 RepID=R7Q5G3_CHOCR|nr:unnamed protein product [Chondrus crispus]CDF33782.1 unnamed protein product [Chondrus crispus]|eukprot:XP_005713601.1 unnamed protein product [Chondrus crispus]